MDGDLVAVRLSGEEEMEEKGGRFEGGEVEMDGLHEGGGEDSPVLVMMSRVSVLAPFVRWYRTEARVRSVLLFSAFILVIVLCGAVLYASTYLFTGQTVEEPTNNDKFHFIKVNHGGVAGDNEMVRHTSTSLSSL